MRFFKKADINAVRNNLELKHYNINHDNSDWKKLSHREAEVVEAINKYHCINGPKLITHFDNIIKNAKELIHEAKNDKASASLLEGNKRVLTEKGASQLRLKGEEIKMKLVDKLIVLPTMRGYETFYQSILTNLPKILDGLVKKGVLMESNLTHPMNLKVNGNFEYPVIRDGKVTSVIHSPLDYPVCKNEDDLKEVYQKIKSTIAAIENNVKTKITKLDIAINGTTDQGSINENYNSFGSFEKFYQSIFVEPQFSARI